MKVGILAGGLGTRLAEETEIRPKPMVEIGAMPILWHIMMHYRLRSSRLRHRARLQGRVHQTLVQRLCNAERQHDSAHLASGQVKRHACALPDWTVDLVETGLNTLTGGRIKRLIEWMGNETFMLTWGDGVSDVDLDKLLAFHARTESWPR